MGNQPLPHDINVAATIQRMLSAGVPMSLIFDTVKDMPNGPRSYTTLYKHYRADIVAAKARLHEAVGSLMMQKALVDKDQRALEFIAARKLGWNEKVVVEESDPTALNEETSAIDDLIAALNLKDK